jgi:hypothetical protein
MKTQTNSKREALKAIGITLFAIFLALCFANKICAQSSTDGPIAYTLVLEEVVCTHPRIFKCPERMAVCLTCPKQLKKLCSELKSRDISDMEYVRYLAEIVEQKAGNNKNAKSQGRERIVSGEVKDKLVLLNRKKSVTSIENNEDDK